MLIVCEKCLKEMYCKKNGIGIHYGNGHVYAGDRYVCSICGVSIVVAINLPNYDPNLDQQDEYIDFCMEKK